MPPQRDWFEKDYYKTLGVSESATQKEITKAYRKLARESHPDQHPGDDAAEERFKDISAAYDVLGDEAKRKEYDEVRRHGPCGRHGRRRRPRRIPVRPVRRRRPRRPLRRPVQPGWSCGRVAAGEARRRDRSPARRRSRHRAAPQLRGRGQRRHHRRAPHLRGGVFPMRRQGRRARHDAARLPDLRRARACTTTTRASSPSPSRARPARAVAWSSRRPARTAGGAGVEHRPREIKVRVPEGVADGQKIRLKGRGGPGRNGGPPGDLHVTVRVGPTPPVRPQGRRSHHHRAGHLRRSRARRRDPGADAGGRTGEDPCPARHPLRARCSDSSDRGVTRGSTTGSLLVTIEVAVPANCQQRSGRRSRRSPPFPTSHPDHTWGSDPWPTPTSPPEPSATPAPST